MGGALGDQRHHREQRRRDDHREHAGGSTCFRIANGRHLLYGSSMICKVVLLCALAFPSLVHAEKLLLLTRDGVVHTLEEGPQKGTNLHVEKPISMARFADGRLVVRDAKGLVVIDGPKRRVVPGDNRDVQELFVVGTRLCATTKGDEVVQIDPVSGKRTVLGKWPNLSFLAADGDLLIATHGKTVEVVGATPLAAWLLGGHPIAIAAAAGHVFVATREGPMYQLDRATGLVRDLGMGGWFNTLGLAADATHLYAVTTSGKVWEIDFAQSKKTALAMDGWQMAIALLVSR